MPYPWPWTQQACKMQHDTANLFQYAEHVNKFDSAVSNLKPSLSDAGRHFGKKSHLLQRFGRLVGANRLADSWRDLDEVPVA